MAGPESRWGRLSVVAACFVVLFSSALRAQLYTGTVTGLITDPSGAVVPGARIEVADEQKGFTFNATTDIAGNYLVRNLPPGTYRISVQATGFKSETRSGIILDVNHNVTVNFQLQLGATAQTVEVTGQAPVLEAQDAVTGQTVDRKFINDLPLRDGPGNADSGGDGSGHHLPPLHRQQFHLQRHAQRYR